jgi:uncharacterized protein
MPYLIDGYNLLHAMGVLHGRVGPLGLERARRALLGLLLGVYGDEASSLTVVFDAAQAPPGMVEAQDYRGIQVRFAVAHDEADDLIELLIRRESVPRRLTVVSDDRRIQEAARRRRCTVLGCAEFLDQLDRRRGRRKPRPADDPAKPQGGSAGQTQHWLAEFAGLENDPAWKELFDAYEFEQTELPPE